MNSWIAITRLGGVNIIIPAAATIGAWLIYARAWRMALWWCLIFTTALLMVVASKIAFIGWGIGIRSLNFTGFSGHSMCATAVIPVLFYLILHRASPMVRACGVLLGISFGIMISISRVILYAHSISETLAGCILGGIVSLTFIRILEKNRKLIVYKFIILSSLIFLPVLFFLKPMPTQHWIIELSLELSGHDRPFVRQGWKLAPSKLNLLKRHEIAKPKNYGIFGYFQVGADQAHRDRCHALAAVPGRPGARPFKGQ